MGSCLLVFLAEAGTPQSQLWGAMPQHCLGQIYMTLPLKIHCGGGKSMYHLEDMRRAVADMERGIDGSRFPSAENMFNSGSLGEVSPAPCPLPILAG